MYYLKSRYYDPQTGRFINADDISYIDNESLNGLNLYAYCLNNPIMYKDSNGNSIWSDIGNWFKDHWVEVVITIGVVAAVVVLTIATAGVGTAVGSALGGGVAATIFGSAVGGAVSGAIISAGISIASQGITNGYDNINWGKVGIDTLIGAAVGGVLGAVSGAVKIGQSASLWDKGTFKSGFQSMRYHYAKHGAGFGNIVNYSKQAASFGIKNAYSMTLNVSRSGLQSYWTWLGKVGVNGYFTSAGKIITFFRV